MIVKISRRYRKINKVVDDLEDDVGVEGSDVGYSVGRRGGSGLFITGGEAERWEGWVPSSCGEQVLE